MLKSWTWPASIGALLFVSLSPAAADPIQELLECSSITGQEERLACFDAGMAQLQAHGLSMDDVLRAQSPSAIPPAATPVVAATPAVPAVPTMSDVSAPAPATPAPVAKEPETLADEFGKPSKAKRRGMFGLKFWERNDRTVENFGRTEDEVTRNDSGQIEKVRVPVTSYSFDTYGKIQFVLENGQVWKQTDSRPVRIKKKDADNFFVEISRGAAGSYTIHVNAKGKYIKAKRLK